MKKLLFLTALAGLFSCNQPASHSDQPLVTDEMQKIKSKIEERENRMVITDDQKKRKKESDAFLVKNNMKLNKNLPYSESEALTTLRTPKEVAERVTVMAAVNQVAFGEFTGSEISDYLKRYHLWDVTTEKEKAFLANPTEEAKNNETWKVEDIWTLLWSLKVVKDLGFPKEFADLKNVPKEQYP